jgi:putative phosphoesterase
VPQQRTALASLPTAQRSSGRRYGVIADVHANIHALDTVLAALRRAGVDRYLCAGDLVGYGPRPNECVERVASLDAVVVAGNHDLIALGRLPLDGLGPLPARTLEWTAEALDSDARAWLAELPLQARGDGGVVVAHGSLDDPTEYVRDCGVLSQLDPGDRVLILGHTHEPLRCEANGRLLFNPGSVGQSRERRPLARALVLDTDSLEADFLALDYDTAATRRELRAAGLPQSACHLAPGRLARLSRKLGALRQ